MSSCRWADERGALPFLAQAEALRDSISAQGSSVSEMLGPNRPRTLRCFRGEDHSFDLTRSSEGLAEPFIRLRDVSVCREDY